MGVPSLDELACRESPMHFGRRPVRCASPIQRPEQPVDETIPHRNVGHFRRYGDDNFNSAATRQAYVAALSKSSKAFHRRKSTTDSAIGFVQIAYQYGLNPIKREAMRQDGHRAGWYSNPTCFQHPVEKRKAYCVSQVPAPPPPTGRSLRRRKRGLGTRRTPGIGTDTARSSACSRAVTADDVSSSPARHSGRAGAASSAATRRPASTAASRAATLRTVWAESVASRGPAAFSDALTAQPDGERQRGSEGSTRFFVQGRLTRGEVALMRRRMLDNWLQEQSLPADCSRWPATPVSSRPASAAAVSARSHRPASRRAETPRPGSAAPTALHSDGAALAGADERRQAYADMVLFDQRLRRAGGPRTGALALGTVVRTGGGGTRVVVDKAAGGEASKEAGDGEAGSSA
eukprot:TRINITY_DN21510_c0_g1_i1.p1 TRINITY_DN21510_c0_g1~~TRINITY_DN21510_c0_g1_i1.p1  ORF type:complete len:405 (+),score=83.46 TRINITY_DN21510_c0_g1_i1:54-1268(+)